MYGNRQSRMERFCEMAMIAASAGEKKMSRKVYLSEYKRLVRQLGLTVTETAAGHKNLIPVEVSWEENYNYLIQQRDQNGDNLAQYVRNFADQLALETLKAEEKNPY